MPRVLPRRRWVVFALLLGSLMQAFGLGQLAITVTQTTWNVGTFGAAQLSGPPGTNFTSTQSSAADYLDINVTTPTLTPNYRVDVSKTDTQWNGSMTLWILRTADGTGTGTITGGNVSFQEITGTARSFFSGSRNRSNVKAQLQLRGLSVIVGPHNFSTTVTYTIVQL